ncbi:hypothetical protein [Streptomyces sp. URMC 125]|uniref:hypothetical protein n=1 Tax=Streptomyces sp. URMC 125 TaxID=3423419 RepID=UPI003F1B7BAC
MLALLVLLALLVIWAVGFGGSGGGGKDGQGGKRDGDQAASSITPGPSSSESLISERPGGRDEASGGTGGSDGSGGRTGSGSGGADGAGGSAGAGGADDPGGATGGGPGGSAGTGATGGSGGPEAGTPGGAEAVPAGSSLPGCRPGSVEVTLRSAENRYAPDEEPTFHLTVRNEGGSACKVDLGSGSVVFTITEAGDGGEKVWKSQDCPEGARSAFYRVPADGTAVRTLEWDRRHSTPGCGTPAGKAGAGTYLVEAEVAGLDEVRTSFVLTKD